MWGWLFGKCKDRCYQACDIHCQAGCLKTEIIKTKYKALEQLYKMKTKNKLPENWCVKAKDTKEFYGTVIEFLNKKNKIGVFDGIGSYKYYGIRNSQPYNGPNPWDEVLSIEEFIALSEVTAPEIRQPTPFENLLLERQELKIKVERLEKEHQPLWNQNAELLDEVDRLKKLGSDYINEICSLREQVSRLTAPEVKKEGSYMNMIPLTSFDQNITKNKNMEKTIKMSLETARQWMKKIKNKTITDDSPESLITSMILENFTKEELEGKEGFTWEESFKPGYVIETNHAKLRVDIKKCSNPAAQNHFKDQFATEKQALAALAFAQLSHIVNKYNEGKEPEEFVCLPSAIQTGSLSYIKSLSANKYRVPFAFYREEDLLTSFEVNKELWDQYFMF